MLVPSRRHERRALRVREYLVSSLAKPITLDETTQALGMSASTIQRAIGATWGIGFQELRERLRVGEFLKMLAKDPELKVEPFAHDVGWQSKANLYSSVLRVTGYSLPELRSDQALLTRALAILATDHRMCATADEPRRETLAS